MTEKDVTWLPARKRSEPETEEQGGTEPGVMKCQEQKVSTPRRRLPKDKGDGKIPQMYKSREMVSYLARTVTGRGDARESHIPAGKNREQKRRLCT